MKTLDDLIKKAAELQASGLLTGQIADELNISRETATWLLAHGKKGDVAPPKDIYINWSGIGRSSLRLRYISQALADMILESLENSGSGVDVVVGIAMSGIPLAEMIAEELGVEFAAYHPDKQRWEGKETKKGRGTISQHFAGVEGKECVIVDDVITTGSTITEAVNTLEELKAKPTCIAVLTDKKGLDSVGGVPVNALLRVTRVDRLP